MPKTIKKEKKQGSKILKYLILVIAIIFFFELMLLILNQNLKTQISETEQKEAEFTSTENSTLVTMKLPAVDSEGKGVSTLLSVEAVKTKSGKGRTLVDIEDLLFWADTQHSIRMARLVAENFSENSVEDFDLIYSVEANASLIGGPSARAAITLTTIFALNAQEPKKDVMITGTINHDSSVGPVTAILEKAKASKQAGAEIFLVPLLQSRDVVYQTTKHCEKFGFTEICTTETIPKKVDVSEEAGIEVIEVANIKEALEYFS